MELMIDREGVAITSWDISIEEAVWRRGFIHICFVGESVVVALSPQLTHPVTHAAAYYAIGDFNPRRIFLHVGLGDVCEVFSGLAAFVNRVHALAVAAGSERSYRGYPDRASSLVATRID